MDTTVSISDKSGRHILQDFLRKVLRLAASRLHDLCGRLDLQDANREEIETQVCINSCTLYTRCGLVLDLWCLDQLPVVVLGACLAPLLEGSWYAAQGCYCCELTACLDVTSMPCLHWCMH